MTLIQGPQKGDVAENDETLATPCANPSIRNLSQEHGQTSETSALSKLHWKQWPSLSSIIIDTLHL